MPLSVTFVDRAWASDAVRRAWAPGAAPAGPLTEIPVKEIPATTATAGNTAVTVRSRRCVCTQFPFRRPPKLPTILYQDKHLVPVRAWSTTQPGHHPPAGATRP